MTVKINKFNELEHDCRGLMYSTSKSGFETGEYICDSCMKIELIPVWM